MPHPAQTLTNHRGHQLSFGPDRHETEISIRKILFHDEIRPQSFRPVITNPVLYASPALCQATQAPPAPCLALTQQGNASFLTSCLVLRLRGERTVGSFLRPFLNHLDNASYLS